MCAITNYSAYKFVPLQGLPELQAKLRAVALATGLKGTILLSEEGINLFVAGPKPAVTSLLEEIRRVPGLEDLIPKESLSTSQPFGRMFVKIKKEIIAFGIPGVDPARRPTRKLPAKTLKQWLDEGRAVTLLDTRNDYEIRLGTFRGALATGIRHFREFPAAAQHLPRELAHQPLVMFCTGGIRCEKAGPYLESQGFTQVHQLDGGILKYFEECGGAHYEGDCFVFDERVGVDAKLREKVAAVAPPAASPATGAP